MPKTSNPLSSNCDEQFAHLIFHRTGGQTLTKDILRPTTLIGSGQGCNIQLVATEVSRSHCVITFDDGELRIRDLRSRSGVTVNGSPVEVQSLHNGDRIGLGSFQATVETNLVATETLVAKQIEELGTRQTDLDSARDDLVAERQELRDELDAFRDEQHRFAEQAATFAEERKSFELAKEADALKAEERESERQELSLRCEQLTAAEEDLKRRHSSLQEELQQAKQTIDSLAADLSASQEQQSLAKQRELDLSQVADKLRFELVEQQEETGLWREQAEQYEDELRQGRAEIVELVSRIEELELASQQMALIAKESQSQAQNSQAVASAADANTSSSTATVDTQLAAQPPSDIETQRENLAADRERFRAEVQEFEELQKKFRDDMILMESYRRPLRSQRGSDPLTMRGLSVALFKCVTAIAVTGALGYLIGWLMIS